MKMNKLPIAVILSTRFLKDIKRLARKYRNVRRDTQTLIDQLERGETPGDQIPGIRHPVYKVRLRNADLSKGKSGGYRVIYYIRTAQRIYIVTMYAKTQRADVSAEIINQLIAELGLPSDE
jgi:mRNA-degrading endonuclease RelE of RelBE toxin-antitoxin system